MKTTNSPKNVRKQGTAKVRYIVFTGGKKQTVRLDNDVASLMNKATQHKVPHSWVSRMFNDAMREKLAQYAGKRELEAIGS